MSIANVCDCVGVIGASGTGKGLFITERITPLLGERPLAAWSPLEATDRYGKKFGGVIVRKVSDLVAQLKARGRAVFVPDDTGRVVEFKGKKRRLFDVQFDLFCLAAWHAQRPVVLAEELSRVTSPSYAPEAWANLATQGRHRGITLYGAAQFPAQIDKSFLGSCTEIRAYRVNEEAHARVMAGKLRVDWEVLMELPDRRYLHRWVRELRWEVGVQGIAGIEPSRVLASGTGAVDLSAVKAEPVTPIRVTPGAARKKKSAAKR